MADIHQEGHSQRLASQKRHMAHLRRRTCCTLRKLSSWNRGGDKTHSSAGKECAHQAACCLSCSDLGRTQNAVPTESVPLWSTQEPEPEQVRPGKCTKPRAYLRKFPCRETWSLSSVDWESTHAVSGGKPSVVHILQAPPTQAIVVFAVFLPPHSTIEQVSLNK